MLANGDDLPELSGCRVEFRVNGGAHTFAGQLLCVGSFLSTLLANLTCKLLPIPANLSQAQQALSDASPWSCGAVIKPVFVCRLAKDQPVRGNDS